MLVAPGYASLDKGQLEQELLSITPGLPRPPILQYFVRTHCRWRAKRQKLIGIRYL